MANGVALAAHPDPVDRSRRHPPPRSEAASALARSVRWEGAAGSEMAPAATGSILTGLDRAKVRAAHEAEAERSQAVARLAISRCWRKLDCLVRKADRKLALLDRMHK